MTSAPQFVPDEVVVRMAQATPEVVDVAVGQTHGLQLLERSIIALLGVRLVRYRVLNNRPLAAAVAALQGDPRVLGPQLNYYYRHLQGDADPSNGLQYSLVKLDVARAQTVARGGGTLIAVIDLGVDQSHPDLQGSVVEAFSAVCGDGSDPHGTEISGIISAHGIVRGVAPEAKLLDVRVFAGERGRQSTATTFNLVRGIDWALSKRARVLNMSFAGPSDSLLEESIKRAAAKGAITVAAAGNGGPQAAPAYPAAYPGVIAVTAIDVDDRLYSARQPRQLHLGCCAGRRCARPLRQPCASDCLGYVLRGRACQRRGGADGRALSHDRRGRGASRADGGRCRSRSAGS